MIIVGVALPLPVGHQSKRGSFAAAAQAAAIEQGVVAALMSLLQTTMAFAPLALTCQALLNISEGEGYVSCANQFRRGQYLAHDSLHPCIVQHILCGVLCFPTSVATYALSQPYPCSCNFRFHAAFAALKAPPTLATLLYLHAPHHIEVPSLQARCRQMLKEMIAAHDTPRPTDDQDASTAAPAPLGTSTEDEPAVDAVMADWRERVSEMFPWVDVVTLACSLRGTCLQSFVHVRGIRVVAGLLRHSTQVMQRYLHRCAPSDSIVIPHRAMGMSPGTLTPPTDDERRTISTTPVHAEERAQAPERLGATSTPPMGGSPSPSPTVVAFPLSPKVMGIQGPDNLHGRSRLSSVGGGVGAAQGDDIATIMSAADVAMKPGDGDSIGEEGAESMEDEEDDLDDLEADAMEAEDGFVAGVEGLCTLVDAVRAATMRAHQLGRGVNADGTGADDETVSCAGDASARPRTAEDPAAVAGASTSQTEAEAIGYATELQRALVDDGGMLALSDALQYSTQWVMTELVKLTKQAVGAGDADSEDDEGVYMDEDGGFMSATSIARATLASGAGEVTPLTATSAAAIGHMNGVGKQVSVREAVAEVEDGLVSAPQHRLMLAILKAFGDLTSLPSLPSASKRPTTSSTNPEPSTAEANPVAASTASSVFVEWFQGTYTSPEYGSGDKINSKLFKTAGHTPASLAMPAGHRALRHMCILAMLHPAQGMLAVR